MGSFNNNVDQTLPNFDPLPFSGQLWTVDMIPTFCHVTKRRLSTEPLPPLLSTYLLNEPYVRFEI